MQAINLVEVALYCDEISSGYNIGRFDQYLYPYYKRDKEAGILTDQDALELLECLWLKIAESLYGPLQGTEPNSTWDTSRITA